MPMRNVFVQRSTDEFAALTADLRQSLKEHADAHDDTAAAWKVGVNTWCDAVCGKEPSTLIGEWHARIVVSLTRAHAKYARAVHSLIQANASAYHAIKYRDVSAIMACSNPLAPVDMTALVSSMSSEDADVFWTYLDELSLLSFRWGNSTPPVVPTSDALARDIATRRAARDVASEGTSSSGSSGAGGHVGGGDSTASIGLRSGMAEMWKQLAAARGVVPSPPFDDDVHARVSKCLACRPTATSDESTSHDDDIVADDVSTHLPELGAAAYTAEQLQVLERMRNLHTMDAAIPSNMMRGIENVAQKLVRDMNRGACEFSSLNIETIGQQVLSQVDEKDVGTFAANLDAILPALGDMHKSFPGGVLPTTGL